MPGRLLLTVATLVCGAVLLTSERAQASEGESNCHYHAHTPHEWVHICANLERGLHDTIRGLGAAYSWIAPNRPILAGSWRWSTSASIRFEEGSPRRCVQANRKMRPNEGGTSSQRCLPILTGSQDFCKR
jgi:hypothetical protein